MDEWRRAVVNALGSAMLLPRVDVTDVGVDCTSEMFVPTCWSLEAIHRGPIPRLHLGSPSPVAVFAMCATGVFVSLAPVLGMIAELVLCGRVMIAVLAIGGCV